MASCTWISQYSNSMTSWVLFVLMWHSERLEMGSELPILLEEVVLRTSGAVGLMLWDVPLRIQDNVISASHRSRVNRSS